ncbi:MAG: XRE family transcriptional regulator [Bacteroidales bacterium]|nr:XRE family transcriptional regulator [Bacteroidales bacterium]
MINIGEAIKEELDRQERSVTWLAAKLGCNRQAVYRIFQKCSIDTHLLLRISLILHRNFFTELSQAANPYPSRDD